MKMDEQKQYEVLATQALEAKRLRDEGLTGMAAQIEELIEKRLGEIVYATGFPPTIRDVKEAVRYASCADCKGIGLVAQGRQTSRDPLPGCEGVKYCACPRGTERYEADRATGVAPITREWHMFPADRYGTPEFLQLCTDQAKEQRAAGRLAIASALERYVESKVAKD